MNPIGINLHLFLGLLGETENDDIPHPQEVVNMDAKLLPKWLPMSLKWRPCRPSGPWSLHMCFVSPFETVK